MTTPTLTFDLLENEISGMIVDTCIGIHRKLGPGLLESVYEMILAYELRKLGLDVKRQHAFPVRWDDQVFDQGFRCDLLVHDKVIVELKSVEHTTPVHKRKLLTYLKLTDSRVGLLLNFGCSLMREGIQRVVNCAESLS